MENDQPATSKQVIKEVGNTREIERYNQFRYERPTYLTVQTQQQKNQYSNKKNKQGKTNSAKKEGQQIVSKKQKDQHFVQIRETGNRIINQKPQQMRMGQLNNSDMKQINNYQNMNSESIINQLQKSSSKMRGWHFEDSFDEKQFYAKFKESLFVNDMNRDSRVLHHSQSQGLLHSQGPIGNINSQNNTFMQFNNYEQKMQNSGLSGFTSGNNSRNMPLNLQSQLEKSPPRSQSQYYAQIDQNSQYNQEDPVISACENTFDFLRSYQSQEDSNYSEKEDLIVNKKFYAKDIQTEFEKKIPKTEIEYLLKEQGSNDSPRTSKHQLIIDRPQSPLGHSKVGIIGTQNDDQYYRRVKNSPRILNNDLSNSLMLIPNQQRRTNNAGKQSPLRSHLPDNGYAEYLQQSQNIQNSLFLHNQDRDFENYMCKKDNSIEPIITRQRRIQQLKQQHYNSSKSKKQIGSEKTFSFKDSLRESTKNRERHDTQDTFHKFSFGPSYQNNYYYNFNNNYKMTPLPTHGDGSCVPSSPEPQNQNKRQVRFATDQKSGEARSPTPEKKCVEVQVSPKLSGLKRSRLTFQSDDENLYSSGEEDSTNIQNLLLHQMQTIQKNKRNLKQNKKQKTEKLKISPQQQQILNDLTQLISDKNGNKQYTKDQLAQIGQYQVQFLQNMQSNKKANKQKQLQKQQKQNQQAYAYENFYERQEFNQGKMKNQYMEQMQQVQMEMYYQNFYQNNIQQFSNSQLITLCDQMNMYIQLLYQALLLVKTRQSNQVEKDKFDISDSLKYKLYSQLYDIVKKKDEAIKQFKFNHNITNAKKFPLYEIPWITRWVNRANEMSGINDHKPFMIHPQVSFFQVPLLEFAPIVIDAFIKPYPMKEENNPIMVFTKLRPLLDQHLLPINKPIEKQHNKQSKHKEKYMAQYQHTTTRLFDLNCEINDPFDAFVDPVCQLDCNNQFVRTKQIASFSNTCQQPLVFAQVGNNRRRFSHIDDNNLLMALKKLASYKEFEAIRDNWLPMKNCNEIKHRIKNLTCRRAQNNIIKRWKFEHCLPLRQGWISQDGVYGSKTVKHTDGGSDADQKSNSSLRAQSDQDSFQESLPLQKREKQKGSKHYYYSEMEKLAQGINWFGTGWIQEYHKKKGQQIINLSSGQISKSLKIQNNQQTCDKILQMSQYQRWNQISRYFLPSRSGEFLKLEYNNIIQDPTKSVQFGNILLSLKKYKNVENSNICQQLNVHNINFETSVNLLTKIRCNTNLQQQYLIDKINWKDPNVQSIVDTQTNVQDEDGENLVENSNKLYQDILFD